jgi:hypothetical protein
MNAAADEEPEPEVVAEKERTIRVIFFTGNRTVDGYVNVQPALGG